MDQNIMPFILDQIPYAIESIIILAVVYSTTLVYVLLRQKSVARMRNMFFQNLDNYVYGLIWFIMITSCLIGFLFFSKNTTLFLVGENAVLTLYLLSQGAFYSMNDSLESCKNR